MFPLDCQHKIEKKKMDKKVTWSSFQNPKRVTVEGERLGDYRQLSDCIC